MNLVKEVEKDGWVLTHEWYLDDLGLRRNSFDLFQKHTRVHYPFLGRPRVSNFDRNTPLEGDDISPHTEEEYWEMFKHQVGLITNTKTL